MYAAAAMLVLGLAGGWGLSRSAILARGLSVLHREDPQPDSRADGVADRIARGEVAGIAAAAAGTAGAVAPDMSLAVFDRAGRPLRVIPADRPWTPRISPDGRRVAYGAFGDGRGTSDLWITDLDDGSTRRITDDDADNNDPQWSPDGSLLAYSVSAAGGKDLMVQNVAATAGTSRMLAARSGVQFASDWLRDGSALLVTDESSESGHDIIVQPADGSAAKPFVATSADETTARISPDGRWVAYTSDRSGQSEVYLQSYPKGEQRVLVSKGGGYHPVWRADGRELFYWSHGVLIVVRLGTPVGDRAPVIGGQSKLFAAPYQSGPNTMYDVSPDGKRFVIVLSSEH
jgi:eukaryotic-like serine/threonine-protein kinase